MTKIRFEKIGNRTMNYDAVAAGTLSEFKKQWSGTERPLIGITVEDAYTKCKELAKIPVKEEKK